MNLNIIRDDFTLSLSYLLRWIVIALIMSLISTVVVNVFILVMNLINSGIDRLGVPPFIWTMTGAVIIALGVYSWAPNSVTESVPSYIRGVNRHRGRLKFRDTCGKSLALLFTVSFLGNGGVVGPLGRICAGLGSQLASISGRIKIRDEDYKLACICGFSAGTAALFHSPIAAGIMAVEISQKTGLNYRRLFPSILASSFTVFICQAAGFAPYFSFSLPYLEPEPLVLIPVFAIALFSGLLGRFYNHTYWFLSGYLRRRVREFRFIRLALIGGAVTLLVGFVHQGLTGTSRMLFTAVFNNVDLLYGDMSRGIPVFWICILLLVIKILSNSVIVASGFSAGFIGTMMLSGMLSGVAFSSLFGITLYSADYFALVTAGFAGVLASCTNVPIAAAILSTEIFGFSFGMPAAVAAIVGFQINRHNTIYDQVEF